jgi:hypothetical protein
VGGWQVVNGMCVRYVVLLGESRMCTMTESGRLLLEESHAIHSVTTQQTEIAKRVRPRVFTTCLDGLSILPFGAV